MTLDNKRRPDSISPALINEFELADELIYLNHAMASPWPRRTATALEEFTRESLRLGASRVADWAPHDVSLRLRFRRLLNADSVEDIALLKNTSEAVSMIAFGFPWQAGDNLVLAAQEFPSNYVAWSALKEAGVETRRVDWEAYQDAEEALMEACDENTRLLAISSVQYGTGFRMDLERLGAFCRANDIVFCIDAIQSLGVIPFDLHRYHADFVFAGVQKWMMAPEGLSVFWSRPAARELLAPTQLGWRSRRDMFDFEPNADWTLEQTARRFESGTMSQIAIRTSNASLSLLEEVGIEAVWSRISDRIDHLANGLSGIPNLEVISDLSDKRRSGMLSFRIPGDNEALYRHLLENGVFCAKRAGGIRFSPHFYTAMAKLDQAIEYIADYSE